MRYAIRHRTTYRYAVAVDVAHHLAHLRPRATPAQTVLSDEVLIEPAPMHIGEHVDHFGNRAAIFAIDRPHDEFDIESRAVVEVTAPAPVDAKATPPWQTLRDSLVADGFPLAVEAAEFIHPSPLVPHLAAADDYARQIFSPGRPIVAAALALTEAINRDFAYEAGVTDTSTDLATVFSQRAGVCQDLAHAQIACLRSLGLAARYVSGYVRTYPRPGRPRRVGADASHAWVSAWCPTLGAPGEGRWIDIDPTNDLIVADEHVVLGWGRDYADVSPVRGVILGGGAHTLEVQVELTPIGAG